MARHVFVGVAQSDRRMKMTKNDYNCLCDDVPSIVGQDVYGLGGETMRENPSPTIACQDVKSQSSIESEVLRTFNAEIF